MVNKLLYRWMLIKYKVICMKRQRLHRESLRVAIRLEKLATKYENSTKEITDYEKLLIEAYGNTTAAVGESGSN